MSERYCTQSARDNFRGWLCLCTWQSNPAFSQPWTAGIWSDCVEEKKKKKNVHNSIRGIHTSCCTENRRLSCLPHSPSQKFYTAQLFPGLSIKSRGWRPLDSQSQTSSEEDCAPSRVRRWKKVFTVFHRRAISQVFKSFSTFLALFWTKFHSHGQNHHNKWMDIIGYTTNL